MKSVNNEGNRDLEEIEPLERAKLEMEYKRIEVEKFKAWGTVISISIPLIVAAITVGYGVWSHNNRAQIDFEIKAAEIVMSAKSPQSAANKAEVLSELFPDRLPMNFEEALRELYSDSSVSSEASK